MENKFSSPIIVAHRGAHTKAILENTIESFSRAFALNADAVEGDFHLTKDKKIVCHHDTKVKNTSIPMATLDTLQTIDPTLPTLKDVLQVVPADKMIYIEIKCGTEIFEILTPVIHHSSLNYAQIVIISFDAAVIYQAKVLYPSMKAYWLYVFSKEEVPDIDNLLHILDSCHADGISTNINTYVDEHFIFAIKEKEYTFHAWIINSIDQARKLKEWGTSSITTDKLEEIREGLRE